MPGSILDQLDQKQRNRFQKHIGILAWFLFLTLASLIFLLPFKRNEKIHLILLVLVSIPYASLLYFNLIPKYEKRPILFHTILGFSSVLIGWAHYILGPYQLRIDKLYAISIIFGSIFGNWKSVIPITVFSIGVNYLVNTTLIDSRTSQYIMIQAFDILGLSIIGVVSGLIGYTLQHFNQNRTRQNRSLSMLVEASRITSTSKDLETTLPQLAANIAHGLPATSCRIAILDRTKKYLLDYGVFPLHDIDNPDPNHKEKHSLDDLPNHRKAIEELTIVFIDLEKDQKALGDKEKDLLFFKDVKTICIVPIHQKGQVFGCITIGEAKSQKRKVIPPNKMELLTSLAKQTASTIRTTQLRQDLRNQANRLAVVYDVGRAISRTIEIDDLLELIYEQLSRVIPSDAYFVALYLPEEDALDLRILIDNEKRYPPQKIPTGEGLSSWIIETHQPLLIKDLEEEMNSLPVKPIVVGDDKITPSWLGVPLISEEDLIGILAVACYQSYAYDESDQSLLEQIAQQAALSIKNARQHMEVKRQAKLDSLTEVYNHGHFIEVIHQEARKAKEEDTPLSLIMLDIDHFKQYNDTYGHVVGDQVLKLTVQAMKEHVKSTDVVGRWGGEEFGIALPNANIEQAEMVAHRIRKTLAELPLYDTQGEPIPKPTVSQGIATLPDHSREIDELIIIADRALYRAKEKGRDQITIAKQG
ncbi:MAG: sensor domain-containing diguanylate cyclase [Anaerolineales bacterium]